jgi:hypothetical protein
MRPQVVKMLRIRLTSFCPVDFWRPFLNKRKLTTEEKRRRKERKAAFVTVFINGRQKRVRRVPLIDGIPADEFLAQNADPLWLHQNGMWELMPLDVETKAAGG